MTDFPEDLPEDLKLPANVDPADLEVALRGLRRRFAQWVCGEIVAILAREGVPHLLLVEMAVPAAAKACHLYNATLAREAAHLARGFVGATLH